MRSTGADQPVRARKAGHAAGAKGVGRAVVVTVQLATGGDLGGNEAVRHPEAVGGEGLSGSETPERAQNPSLLLHRAHSEAQPGSLRSLDGPDADRLLGGSGVSREAPAPFCERPEVKLLRPTRPMLSDFKTRGFN